VVRKLAKSVSGRGEWHRESSGFQSKNSFQKPIPASYLGAVGATDHRGNIEAQF
jgi:hypothetical protein